MVSFSVLRVTIAWIGAFIALSTLAVAISTVADMPGRSFGTFSENTALTVKFVTSSWVPRLRVTAVLAISVTTPAKLVSGKASTLMVTFCPSLTSTTSVSSISASISMRDRSAIDISTVPGCFSSR